MENIGEILKNARTKMNLTIEQITEKTRIKAKFLTDIENNDFSDLDTGYAKAMITTFAKTVGANERELLIIFENTHSNKNKFTRNATLRSKNILIPTNLLYLIVLVILAIVLTFTIIKFYKTGVIKLPQWKRHKMEKVEKPKHVTKEKGTKNKPEKEVEQKKVETVVPKSKKEVSFNQNALQDTTDYLNELLFEGEDSPLNIKR
jgi:cytoskeletal protein RodZ